MPTAISSKGKDIKAWRPAADFAAGFRQALMDKTANMTSAEAERLVRSVLSELENKSNRHDLTLDEMQRLTGKAAVTTEPAQLGKLFIDFYRVCYDQFAENRSAIAFYSLSQKFLESVATALLASARTRMGIPGAEMQPVALIALGAAGRQEYSPFSDLQLLLLTDISMESNSRFAALMGEKLVEICEEAGIRIDRTISPVNPEWRGTPAERQQKIAANSAKDLSAVSLEMFRLAEQAVLVPCMPLTQEFSSQCRSLLRKNRGLLSFVLSGIRKLSNGIGLFGRLRLEKNGGYPGMFALFDHAINPLSASVTALSLIIGGGAIGTTERIRELLSNQAIGMEQGEFLLEAWHTLNEIRLSRERELFPDVSGEKSHYLDTAALSDAQLERLREALEMTKLLQRHVAVNFRNWEDQAAC